MAEPSFIPPLPGANQPSARPRMPLKALRCVRHEEREAAGRCVECARDFCRECLGEHDGRMLCATCHERIVKAVAKQEAVRSIRFRGLFRRLGTAGVFVLLWLMFFGIGMLLVRIPPTVHEDKLWVNPAEEAQP